MTTITVVKAKKQKERKLTMENMLGLALREVRGLLNDLMEKLCGEDSMMWFEALKKFLRKENPWGIQIIWSWKKIKLGTLPKSCSTFCMALTKANYGISEQAQDVVRGFDFIKSDKEIEVEPVVVNRIELGLKKVGSRDEIYHRVEKLGLSLCPAEVGPQFILQHGVLLSRNERIFIGMKPIKDSSDAIFIFGVYRDRFDKLWLDAYPGGGFCLWDSTDRWMFLRN